MRKGIILVAVALSSVAMAGGPVKAKVESLKWMAGTWQCEKWGGVFEEHWTPCRGGTMLGVGRLTAGGKTNFAEFMSLEPEGQGVTMWIMVGNLSKKSKPEAFKLTRLTAKEAVFERPGNDFPTKITYRPGGKDAMNCRIEGMQNGKASAEDFAFKRSR